MYKIKFKQRSLIRGLVLDVTLKKAISNENYQFHLIRSKEKTELKCVLVAKIFFLI